jgi:DNA-binding beta-propeller fold protein YncE
MKVTLRIALLLIGLMSVLPAQSMAQTYHVVAPATIPGYNAANTADVLRFEVKKNESLSSLSPIPAKLVNDPAFVVFNSRGELFVGNRHGNVLNGFGSISRFRFDAKGRFIANGTITGNSLEAVHGLAFVPTGELFAANLRNGLISRFLFTAGGNAVPNGTIFTGEIDNMGVAFSSNGEMFTTHNPVVRRWIFDVTTGAAIPNGSFSPSGATFLHGLAFDAKGELFITDLADRVFRILFNENGDPISNGSIPVPGGPDGVAFSPRGELFVASHFSGVISRFLFDAAGNYISNGSLVTPGTLGGIAIDGPGTANGKN